MDLKKTGPLIRSLRLEQRLTQNNWPSCCI